MESYEIEATANYLLRHDFRKVALQFPDELLSDSVEVASALGKDCGPSVRLFVMADTTYGSCCVDEVAAAHVNADCVVHYGPACLSPVANLPVYYVFGRAPMDVEAAAEALRRISVRCNQPLLVLHDLEYEYAISRLRQRSDGFAVEFAEIVGREMNSPDGPPDSCDSYLTDSENIICGLKWKPSLAMEEYTIVWIGKEGPGLTNVMLTYNQNSIVRYDPETDSDHDMSAPSKALQRRYYLIERAKDANIVGIVVGTLGVAGYFQAIQKIKEMVQNAGKKSYTLVVGKPNPAKLANFPECDVFVLVACPQSAFMDSKEYVAPLITPFEAQLAFVRGAHWTGSYNLDFRKVQTEPETAPLDEEPRFSFLQGGYVDSAYDAAEESSDKALSLDNSSSSLTATSTNSLSVSKSAAGFFANRRYQGLSLNANEDESDRDYRAVTGRRGRAAVYQRNDDVSTLPSARKIPSDGHCKPGHLPSAVHGGRR